MFSSVFRKANYEYFRVFFEKQGMTFPSLFQNLRVLFEKYCMNIELFSKSNVGRFPTIFRKVGYERFLKFFEKLSYEHLQVLNI